MSDQALVNSLNALLNPRQRQPLKAVEPRGALPGRRVRADYAAKATDGGIASPVVEQDYAQRQFWPGGTPSSDGLLVLPAWRRVVMTDANGAEHFFDYAEPL